MKKILLTLAAISMISVLSAQQLTMFSQYTQNKYAINPAVAGSTTSNPLTLMYRQLWTGIDDAPSYQLLSYHMEVVNRMGVGGKIFNYSTGPNHKSGIEATYAYHIPITSSGAKLALGLSGLLYQYKIDRSKITLEDPNDNSFLYNSENLIVPDANFGAYFYTDKYYAGLAVAQLFSRKVNLMNKKYLNQNQVRHYFLHGGYIWEINDKFTLEPSALIRYIEAGIFQFDVNAKVMYNKMVYGGLSYRYKDAVSIQIGFSKDPFLIGYSYDVSLSDIRKYSNGSHELVFIYKINRSKPKL
jgi:type IX secretion system PorP/SprF family membrane protein